MFARLCTPGLSSWNHELESSNLFFAQVRTYVIICSEYHGHSDRPMLYHCCIGMGGMGRSFVPMHGWAALSGHRDSGQLLRHRLGSNRYLLASFPCLLACLPSFQECTRHSKNLQSHEESHTVATAFFARLKTCELRAAKIGSATM